MGLMAMHQPFYFAAFANSVFLRVIKRPLLEARGA
jgi:hypothetical protein